MTILKTVINYLVKNLYQIINLVEAVLRVAAAIVSLTPSTKDDSIVEVVKGVFEKIKSFLSNLQAK